MPVPGIIPRLAGADYSGQRTFFVTLCVKDRKEVFRDPRLAELAKAEVIDRRDAGWYWLLCYCVMPDHVHLLLRLRGPGTSLSRIMTAPKNSIYYRARRAGAVINWQLGYHDRVLRHYESVRLYARYVLANPVRAGIVRQHTDYPFCGIIDRWF